MVVIRNEEVGNMASSTSVYPVVRKKLVELTAVSLRRPQMSSWMEEILERVCFRTHRSKIYLTASVCDTGKDEDTMS